MVLVMLILSFVYASYRVVPVYIEKGRFEEDLIRVATIAQAEKTSRRDIKDQVTELARIRGFHVDRNNIRISKVVGFSSVPEMRIDVDYRASVKFPVYTHTFSFKSSASSVWGSL